MTHPHTIYTEDGNKGEKTEYWILNTFPYNRVLLRNMLIYIAKHSFLYRKNIEMRPIKNRASFLTKFQIVSVLLKIDPYHMPKFGKYRKSSYLCTSNRRNSLSYQKAVIIEDRSWSKMMAGAGHQWRPRIGGNEGFPGSCDFLRTFKNSTEYD